MAALASILGTTAYLDTNLFIYAVEGYRAEEAFIRDLFGALEGEELRAVTSELTLAELLVKPFTLRRQDLAATYTELLQLSNYLTVVPSESPVLVEAARQRASLGILMPDAIHVATALAAACDLFLTNDRRLRLPPRIRKVILKRRRAGLQSR